MVVPGGGTPCESNLFLFFFPFSNGNLTKANEVNGVVTS